MSSGEWSLAAVHDVIAGAVPEREMIVCGTVRRTYADVLARSRSLATFLVDRGLGLRRERAELERWEGGQDTVALVLHNGPEYLEAMLGSYRARAVPFNVNQHYRAAEVTALVADLDPRAVVYHRRYAPLVAAMVGDRPVVLLHVDDGSAVEPLPGSTAYEDAVVTVASERLPATSPDDLYLVCTGGTTGRPKAVMWRQADIYVSAMAGVEGASAASIAAGTAGGEGQVWYPVPPLMHAAAQWTAFCALHLGATVVLHDDAEGFDARTVLETAARERAFMMTIVGDAHARPMIDELRSRPHDLSSLVMIGTGGAATNEQCKRELLELLPQLLIRDGYGASETGGMAYGARTKGSDTDGFEPSAGAVVVSADRSRVLEPGDDEVGWTARRGRVPLGYLGDREKTEQVFPIIAGERVSIPGDRAQVLPDGHIRLLGRDSMVINTGGEKVFVEEVEDVLRRHRDVADAVVVGRPSERFGQEVVALVAAHPGARIDPPALREHVASELARFKAPRAVLVCEAVPRLANGKADYAWAVEAARAAEDVTGAGSTA